MVGEGFLDCGYLEDDESNSSENQGANSLELGKIHVNYLSSSLRDGSGRKCSTACEAEVERQGVRDPGTSPEV